MQRWRNGGRGSDLYRPRRHGDPLVRFLRADCRTVREAYATVVTEALVRDRDTIWLSHSKEGPAQHTWTVLTTVSNGNPYAFQREEAVMAFRLVARTAAYSKEGSPLSRYIEPQAR